MTPAAGEAWLADSGDEVRRLVLVISDPRLHALAGRAIVAPIVAAPGESPPPWYVPFDADSNVAVHLLASIDVDRLLERSSVVSFELLRRVRRVVALLTT